MRSQKVLWSQIYGLSANVVVPRLEGAPRDNVDADAQEFLEILEQADVIKKRGAWLKVHQQVKVATRASLSPGDGAEYRDPMSPALPRDGEDLRTATAQLFQGQHLVGHSSRVSPLVSSTLRTEVWRPSRRRAQPVAAARGCHHAPVTRCRTKSRRTVAMPAPGSPRPSAARLSEMRAAASVSLSMSKVISRRGPGRSSVAERSPRFMTKSGKSS
jgi:hypothetical protein